MFIHATAFLILHDSTKESHGNVQRSKTNQTQISPAGTWGEVEYSQVPNSSSPHLAEMTLMAESSLNAILFQRKGRGEGNIKIRIQPKLYEHQMWAFLLPSLLRNWG